MPRPKLRTPELRDRVLAAALELLAAEGTDGFTTRTVARRADTSPPAIYELFGDKSGLVREVFYEGFRRLGDRLATLEPGDDCRRDLHDVVAAVRAFARENPVLFAVMFARPFADFEPGPQEVAVATTVRRCVTDRVRRCVDAGLLRGDVTDLAHIVLALMQGLWAQEAAGWLGRSRASVDRRWSAAVDALLATDR
jgi:AcrR family transcriptional regulator